MVRQCHQLDTNFKQTLGHSEGQGGVGLQSMGSQSQTRLSD